ncbi:DUF3800 domain-containing protein [Candidatus Methanoperedens nitratireducens]|uniref:DUF3800 domain-containing protein n=1 Tax=Candidatus Methanoperedens nitratireducens TaxID=1392998 RepID=A0A284VJQ0_9EURY|nr:DUF3800 domain-containing protein [Candidatus Methanoperedens nitroreducens]SNQ59419.1 hypothetical protein MNV_1190002 [Candidatus Methanoperedens nitroreducens]
MYIYLDESGDLGFDLNSSKHIVIALLITKNPHKIERCIKNIRERKLKKKLKELPEIKFNNSDELIREKTLTCIGRESIEIAYIVLDKNRLNPGMQTHKQEIYNFIAGYLMRCLPYENTTYSKLIVDKRIYNKVIRAEFDQYMKQKAAFNYDLIKDKIKISRQL